MRQGFHILLASAAIWWALKVIPERRQPASVYPEIQDFRLFDQEGHLHRLFDYADAQVVHLIAFDRSCTTLTDEMADLRITRQSYFENDPRAIYLFLDSNPTTSRDLLKEWSQKNSLQAVVLHDDTQGIARQLNFKRCGDWITLDPKGWKIKKRRQMIVDGQEIPFRPYRTISFTNEIVPILESKCMICHREGGMAPWQMTDYPTVKGWVGMMKDVIHTRRMPPWGYDADVGNRVTTSFQLQSAERTVLIEWIQQGAPKDFSGPDPLAKVYRDFKLPSLGPPDLVIKLPTRAIPATGVFDLVFDQLDLGFTEDKWLRAAHMVPSRPRSVHHSELRLILPEDLKPHTGWKDLDQSMEDVVTAFIPGMLNREKGDRYPHRIGRRIPKGARGFVQTHYVSVGRPETVELHLELYFHKSRPQYEFKVMRLGSDGLVIPPGVKNHTFSKIVPIEQTISITGVCPHMHARGKWMRYSIQRASGEKVILFSQPHYRFKWQTCYTFEDRTVAYKGDSMVIEGGFDNSVLNPDNPDPKAYVFQGDMATDEMLVPFVSFVEGYLPSLKEIAD